MSIMPLSRDWQHLCAQYHQVYATAKEAGTLREWAKAKGVHPTSLAKHYKAWKKARGL